MFTYRKPDASGKRLRALAAVLMVSAALAGCSQTSKMTTGSVGRGSGKAVEQMSTQELRSAEVSLGHAYARQPGDKATGMRYASVLQMTGNTDQSLAVMRRLAIQHSKDRQVLAAYGKALAAAAQFEQALDAVRRAQTPEYPDWKLMSAEGAILDQLGQQQEARAIYRRALQIQPGEPSILSNFGMSFLLEGDLKSAEAQMRQAAQSPQADSRVRQNLALVVGLQGRFEEAESIARQELSPEQAQANVTYLRTMLAQQNAWSQLSKDEKKDAREARNTN